MNVSRTLVVVAGLCALLPGRTVAQVEERSDMLPLAVGDSVRIWSRPPESFTGFRARVSRLTVDSLALSTGTVLNRSSLIQLEVGRRVRVRGGGERIAGGAIGGLFFGALVGGVIGAASSRSEGGMGALIGVPVGAVVGAVAGSALGAREHTVTRWMHVPLGGR